MPNFRRNLGIFEQLGKSVNFDNIGQNWTNFCQKRVKSVWKKSEKNVETKPKKKPLFFRFFSKKCGKKVEKKSGHFGCQKVEKIPTFSYVGESYAISNFCRFPNPQNVPTFFPLFFHIFSKKTGKEVGLFSVFFLIELSSWLPLSFCVTEKKLCLMYFLVFLE